jgi:hypothetical protein
MKKTKLLEVELIREFSAYALGLVPSGDETWNKLITNSSIEYLKLLNPRANTIIILIIASSCYDTFVKYFLPGVGSEITIDFFLLSFGISISKYSINSTIDKSI